MLSSFKCLIIFFLVTYVLAAEINGICVGSARVAIVYARVQINIDYIRALTTVAGTTVDRC